MVSAVKKKQKTIQGIICDPNKKDAALNAQIDRLVAEEVAKAKARAEAEAKRKAEAERKRKAEELARKKAEAERIERENARRVAEAREREERARARAEEASARDKERAEMEARRASAEREAAERKAKVENERSNREVERAREASHEALTFSSEDRALSSNFESNRGRLPMPITGGYRIVSHFGQYNVEGLKNVTLDNKGINILGSPGAQARSIFNGEVSAVFSFGGQMIVMVRHGKYISVYCNLRSVSVSRGQKVSTRQVLGTVGSENILQFQLRKETAKLNPESWLGR
jgi:septal ring factor EnvC (AmiA/AmiB activator)